VGASRPAVDSFRHAWEPSGRLCEKTSRFEMAKRDRTVTAPSPRRSRLSVRERELRRRAAWSGAATTRRRAAAAATTRCVAVERACRSGGSGPCECTVVISRVIDVSQFRAARHRGPVHQAMAHLIEAVSSCMERRSSQASCATPHTDRDSAPGSASPAAAYRAAPATRRARGCCSIGLALQTISWDARRRCRPTLAKPVPAT
jgi:hypothetical protein